MIKRVCEAVLGVPVFVKVMGIALGIIFLFGVGMLWQIRTTEMRMAQSALRSGGGEFSREHHAQEMALLSRQLARLMALLTVVALLWAWLLTRILVRPLQELVAGTHRIREGVFATRVPVRSRDDIGDLAVAFNEMAATLEQKEAARQRLARQVMSAEEEERKRVARELHDHTGQALTALIAELSAQESRVVDEESRCRLADLRRLAEQTLQEVHDLSRALRPAALDDLGLVPALQKHCELFGERSGLDVRFSAVGLEPATRLAGEVEIALYRMVQEALTNALRHGQARQVQVLLERQPNRLLLVVEDDGKGFAAGHGQWRERLTDGQHFGLLGLEERATLLGGSFCLESMPGGGTQVFVEIPLREGIHG